MCRVIIPGCLSALQVGPITLAVIVMISLSLIMLAAVKDLVMNNKTPPK
jgi:hypothetical protein